MKDLLREALEHSAYFAPNDFGLSREELHEVAQRMDIGDGEFSASLHDASERALDGNRKLRPRCVGVWSDFSHFKEPDLRDPDSFEFVLQQMALLKANQANSAGIDRAVLVERALATGLPALKVQAAITILVVDNRLEEKNGVLRVGKHWGYYEAPSVQIAKRDRSRIGQKVTPEERLKLSGVVEDVIARRTDGRVLSAEPFPAFAETLGPLGYGAFRGWWTQTTSELRQADPNTCPTTVTVLAAALVEGALTFIVQHARAVGLGPMGSTDFKKSSDKWKLLDLITSATKGSAPILDESTGARARKLNETRQRIHAGRMLHDYASGPPELRPEAAREAVATAKLVVRSVLDWVRAHPPSAG